MVSLSSSLSKIASLDAERENFLLSVRSNRWKISLDVRLSKIRATRSPETYNINEFLFFINIA